MSIGAIFLLVVIAVLVGTLAAYLIRVIFILRHVTDTLGKVVFGVRAIAFRTEPIGSVVTDLNANLSAVAGALEGLVAKSAEAEARKAS
ncbi:MAG: hypothetical protein ACYCV7_11990 [Acidimicrobiales bacterium]